MSGSYTNASANELGLHRRVGGRLCAQSETYPFPEHYVRQIRREIDPQFVPLWAETLWMTPNDGLVKTGCHVLARHVKHPKHRSMAARVEGMPIRSLYGIRYENPILVAAILDGLTDKDRDKGVIPKFEPITGQVIDSMRYAMWMRNNTSVDEQIAERERRAEEADKASTKSIASELAYRRQHDDLRIRRAQGKADRVYVSDTLTKLREAAGVEKVA